MYQKNTFAGKRLNNGVKEALKSKIQSFALMEQPEHQESTATNLEDANVSVFQSITWMRKESKYGMGWTIRRDSTKSVSEAKGPDTLLRMKKDRTKKTTGNNTANRNTQGNAEKRKTSSSFPTAYHEDSIPTYDAPNTIEDSLGSDEGEGPWPDVDPDNMSKVTTRMLTELRRTDYDRLFERPVLETMPQLKYEYLQVVSKPMDFQTIEKERAPIYTSTRELHDDLILIFDNCIRFNGKTSPYGKISQRMLDSLDDIFHSVVTGKRRRKNVDYSKVCKVIDVPLAKMPSTSRTSTQTYKKAAPANEELRKQLRAEQQKVKELRMQLADAKKRIREYDATRGSLVASSRSRKRTQPIGGHEEEKSEGITFHFSSSRSQPKRQWVRGHEEENEAGSIAHNCRSGCQVCKKDNHQHVMIICHGFGCEDEFHTYCLDPPLSSIPNGKWYCSSCKEMGLSEPDNVSHVDLVG